MPKYARRDVAFFDKLHTDEANEISEARVRTETGEVVSKWVVPSKVRRVLVLGSGVERNSYRVLPFVSSCVGKYRFMFYPPDAPFPPLAQHGLTRPCYLKLSPLEFDERFGGDRKGELPPAVFSRVLEALGESIQRAHKELDKGDEEVS